MPWEHELASIKKEGVPTDANVELIFAPIAPLFPTPEITTFPLQLTMASTALLKDLGKLLIRTPGGGGRGYGPIHSQNLEKIFFGFPNLEIVSPNLLIDPFITLNEFYVSAISTARFRALLTYLTRLQNIF